MRLASRENISASLTSLARRKNAIYCEACESRNLRDSQTSKMIIHSEKLVLDPKFSQDSRVKISNDSWESRYKISVCESRESRYKFVCKTPKKRVLVQISFCETRKKRFPQRNFVAKLASCESRYEISVCETREKRVSLLILSRESRENFGSKKRVSLENFKKWFSCQP
jgi:hypothetical protein